jgi:hypothetical protein
MRCWDQRDELVKMHMLQSRFKALCSHRNLSLHLRLVTDLCGRLLANFTMSFGWRIWYRPNRPVCDWPGRRACLERYKATCLNHGLLMRFEAFGVFSFSEIAAGWLCTCRILRDFYGDW